MVPYHTIPYCRDCSGIRFLQADFPCRERAWLKLGRQTASTISTIIATNVKGMGVCWTSFQILRGRDSGARTRRLHYRSDFTSFLFFPAWHAFVHTPVCSIEIGQTLGRIQVPFTFSFMIGWWDNLKHMIYQPFCRDGATSFHFWHCCLQWREVKQ